MLSKTNHKTRVFESGAQLPKHYSKLEFTLRKEGIPVTITKTGMFSAKLTGETDDYRYTTERSLTRYEFTILSNTMSIDEVKRSRLYQILR